MALGGNTYVPLEPGPYGAEFLGIKDEVKELEWGPHARLDFQVADSDESRTMTWDVPILGDALIRTVWILTGGITGGTIIPGVGTFDAAKNALKKCQWAGLVMVGRKGYIGSGEVGICVPAGNYTQRFVRFSSRDKDTGLACEIPGSYNNKQTWTGYLLSQITEGDCTGYLISTRFPVSYRWVKQEDGTFGISFAGPQKDSKATDDKKKKKVQPSGMYIITVAQGVTPQEFALIPFREGATQPEKIGESPLPLLEELFIKHANGDDVFSGTVDKTGRQAWQSLIHLGKKTVNKSVLQSLANAAKEGEQSSANAHVAGSDKDIAELQAYVDEILAICYGKETPMAKDGKLTNEGVYFGKNCIRVISGLPNCGITAFWPPSGDKDGNRKWTQNGIDFALNIFGAMATLDNEKLMTLVGESEVSHAALIEWINVLKKEEATLEEQEDIPF